MKADVASCTINISHTAEEVAGMKLSVSTRSYIRKK
jgi:hypothetical protein